jgi:predicted phosphodiesterase
MRLACVSDLHLGVAEMNRCTTPPAALRKLLDELRGSHDELIGVGDLYDLSRPRRLGGWEQHYRQIRAAWREVAALLDEVPSVFGNHDEWLAGRGVPEERAWATGAGLVLARHGHQWDGGLKRLPGLEIAANFVAGWGHRLGWRGIDGAFQGAQEIAQGAESRTHRGACAVLEAGLADVLVMGHTHRLGLEVVAGRLLVQTGSHCHGYQDWASIDTDRGVAEAWRDGRRFAAARRGDDGQWRLVEA